MTDFAARIALRRQLAQALLSFTRNPTQALQRAIEQLRSALRQQEPKR